MIDTGWPYATVVFKDKKTGKVSTLEFPCVNSEQALKFAKKLRGGTKKIVSVSISYKVEL